MNEVLYLLRYAKLLQILHEKGNELSCLCLFPIQEPEYTYHTEFDFDVRKWETAPQLLHPDLMFVGLVTFHG